MSSQDFERALREWLRQGEGPDVGGDPRQLWRERRGRRTRRVLMGGAAGLGLVAAAAAGVLAIGGGLLPEATDTGPAGPTVTAPETTAEREQQEPTTAPEPGEEQSPTAADPEQTTGAQDGSGEQDGPPAGCSTGAYSADEFRAEGLPAPVAATAQQLLTAALGCDQQSLIAAAEEDETTLSFGGVSAADALGIPREDPAYLKLAVLLTATSWTTVEQGSETMYVWPAAYAADSTEADWQELRDSGLHNEETLELMSGPGEGYLGWRTGITESGDWRFFVAGD